MDGWILILCASLKWNNWKWPKWTALTLIDILASASSSLELWTWGDSSNQIPCILKTIALPLKSECDSQRMRCWSWIEIGRQTKALGSLSCSLVVVVWFWVVLPQRIRNISKVLQQDAPRYLYWIMKDIWLRFVVQNKPFCYFLGYFSVTTARLLHTCEFN